MVSREQLEEDLRDKGYELQEDGTWKKVGDVEELLRSEASISDLTQTLQNDSPV